MNMNEMMELGALADAVYSQHGAAMQKALFGTVVNANPASPKAKALTRNALMGLAGFGLVYYAHKLYKDRA
jgi:hypothetical protein